MSIELDFVKKKLKDHVRYPPEACSYHCLKIQQISEQSPFVWPRQSVDLAPSTIVS